MRCLDLDLDVTYATFSQKVSKGLVNLPFYRVMPCTCETGASGTGTSPLPRPMQMVTMGATICMDPGIGL